MTAGRQRPSASMFKALVVLSAALLVSLAVAPRPPARLTPGADDPRLN